MEKILKKLKKLLRLIFGRTTLGTLFLLIQILVLFAGFNWFREYLIYMYGGSAMLSALVLIYIISDEGNSTIKLSWVVPILIFPVFGTLFYLFLTLQPGTRRINRRIEEVGTKLRPYLLQDPEVLAHYESISASGGNLVRYMNQYGRFPAYENTGVRYFPLGDDMFPVLLEELKKAEHFIFMEYFIVEHGVMWDAILQVFEAKSAPMAAAAIKAMIRSPQRSPRCRRRERRGWRGGIGFVCKMIPSFLKIKHKSLLF